MLYSTVNSPRKRKKCDTFDMSQLKGDIKQYQKKILNKTILLI